MSEKLTVAELLARNGRGGSSDDARPRRRRRNLTEGGVSVAELTGSIPVVREEHVSAAADAAANGAVPLKSERSRHAIVADDAAQKPPAAPAVDKVAAGSAPVADKPVAPETPAAPKAAQPEPKPAAAKTAAAEKPAAAQNPTADKEPAAGNTPAAAALAADAGASGEKGNTRARPKEFEELEASLADYEVVDYEDNRISWPIMLLQALAAIAGGVGIFLIFNLLWNTISPMICLVLAMVVTLAMVVGVHMLLRHKDKLLMLLAMLVGLVLTIGPRLILGI